MSHHSTEDINKRLLDALAADPSTILKALQKLAKTTGLTVESPRVSRSTTHKDYLNSTKTTCSLCGAVHTEEFPMSYDVEQRCYRINRTYTGERSSLEIHKVRLIADNCSSCSTRLMEYSKESLITLLISKTKRDEGYYKSLQQLARELNECPEVL